MKKSQAKRQRTPKRGPGVAELEKILKEQQQGGQDSGTNYQPPPSWPPHLLPLLPNLELLSGGPEKALFPTTPVLGDSTKSSLPVPPDFFPNFQSSPSALDFYNSLVNNNNIIPGSASATSSAATATATARLFHQIEHPSSQRSTHFSNLWTSPEEQEKIVCSKRPRALGEEMRGGIMLTMNMKESSSSSSSSLEINRTATPFNFDPNLRVTKRGFGGQLMSSTRSSQLQAEEISNFMALGPSSSSSAPIPNEFPEFNFRIAQEIMEGSEKRAGGGSGSVRYNKIMFNSSFHESKLKGSKEAAIGSSYKGAVEAGAGAGTGTEDERDGVDLDLKL
ncbi:uncharacterized protein LOC111010687 [Momordica charantia]|uniref:Uncharacterized protein LOC111010687 n=1 Tax=Momordica charantia TaxID=3673 RepID=A0A6J1CE76_MOMCH|nr:uncharacterized protein LOC111010687 [Momordica charantia]